MACNKLLKATKSFHGSKRGPRRRLDAAGAHGLPGEYEQSHGEDIPMSFLPVMYPNTLPVALSPPALPILPATSQLLPLRQKKKNGIDAFACLLLSGEPAEWRLPEANAPRRLTRSVSSCPRRLPADCPPIPPQLPSDCPPTTPFVVRLRGRGSAEGKKGSGRSMAWGCPPEAAARRRSVRWDARRAPPSSTELHPCNHSFSSPHPDTRTHQLH